MITPRQCAWCGDAIPDAMRVDARFCSRRCRQAHWRFGVHAVAEVASGQPMRFAYADPPYPGKSGYYEGHRDYGGEVDHHELVARLVAEYPDGWALSTSSGSARDVWALCPPGTRLQVWVKPARYTKSARPLQACEPVLIHGGRPLATDRPQATLDALVARGRFRAFPGALVGMKPPPFATWLFESLGARKGDEFVDLFPGSGAVTYAWARWTGEDASPPGAGDVSSLEERHAA